MVKLKLFFVVFSMLCLLNFNTAWAQHVQKYRTARHYQKYRSTVQDPELVFLLKLLKGGPVTISRAPPGKIQTVSRNLRFLASILGKNTRIEAIKKRKITYIAHTDYNSLKFRLWVVNSQTSKVIDGLYRPKQLFEHKNGVFELILGSKWSNLVLKFVPYDEKYQIIMKYRRF
tara:strand:+ start:1217 stop:1735 length:519 start_codon:yes stop_codon:yes gene_type:complete